MSLQRPNWGVRAAHVRGYPSKSLHVSPLGGSNGNCNTLQTKPWRQAIHSDHDV